MMYREMSEGSLKIEDFYLPFGGHLNEDNRWVVLSEKIPWQKIEREYLKKQKSPTMGAPSKPVRVALGALIIKEKLQISDREVVEQIRENPYLQYFIGLEGFLDAEPFASSLMPSFRARFDGELLGKVNEILFKEHQEEERKKKRKIRQKLKKKKI
jgi:hypothetical protein